MIIVLCGYMGSGKSLIAKKLAEEISFDFMDLDQEIEKNQEMKISEIFSTKGEISFRKTETEVLKTCLNTKKNTVLALGGGTPCYGKNLQIIKENPNTTLVYLKVNLETLTNRLFSEKDERPLLKTIESKEKLDDFIRKHLFERQYYYMQSDFKVESSTLSPAEIVKEIVDLLQIKK